MLVQSEQPDVETNSAVWYLGIDFGTTGISAVLLNQSTAQRYAIYWSNELQISQEELRSVNPQLTVRSSNEVILRLPAVTYSGSVVKKLFDQLPVAPIVVGSLASSLASKQPGLFLQNFKPYLNIAIPYYCHEERKWEPQLQLNKQQIVSLSWVRQTLQALLATLTPQSTLPEAMMKVGAVGLKSDTLKQALGQLEGVIIGCSSAWGDTYRLNLREAILAAKLVRHPEQIFFLEDAIATLLTVISNSNTNDQQLGEIFHSNIEQTPLSNISWRGGTLMINAGATTTEMALVNLPNDLTTLTHSDFSLCSLPYGGNAIDQDIFCQLIYPQMSEEQLQKLAFNNDWELPLPSQADPQKRDRLSLLLQSSAFGQALLKAAGYLKLILQHKDEFILELGNDQWKVKCLDLANNVIEPFIQQLNQQLNALIIQTGLSDQEIFKVIFVGGTANLESLKNWIQQKLPNATLVQATPNSNLQQRNENPTPNLSLSTFKAECWVAAGLATLPLYPQILNRSQHQYSDYFLLLELLRAFPETADDAANLTYSLEEIMQKLERRGLNTSACYERLVCLLKNQMPPGLVPSAKDNIRLSQASRENLQNSYLLSTPLFSQEDNHNYRLNHQQQQRLCQYLNQVLSGTYQKFEEPLIIKSFTRNTSS